VGKMGMCRGCDEYAWIIDGRGFCVDCESSRLDTLSEETEAEQYAQSLDSLDTMRKNLQCIEERISEYVLSTDIPLQLVKEAKNLKVRMRTLETFLKEKHK